MPTNADGTFTETNVAYPFFPADAQVAGARVLAADFNGDGRADLILVGGTGWTTIDLLSPFGRSGGSIFSRPSAPTLAQLASTPGVNTVTVTVSTGRTW